MKTNAKRFTSLFLAALLIISLAACGTSSNTPAATSTAAASAGDKPVYGGKLVSYHSEFYNEYEPNASTMKNYVSFYTDMLWNLNWETDRSKFDFSTSYIDSNYLTGQIAKEWTNAADFTSMTVKIRDDVYFQDKSAFGMDAKYDIYKGRQLKASDVKYSYDRLLGLDGVPQVKIDMTNWQENLSMLKSVEVVDDYTVKFNFKTKDALAVNNFMCAFVSVCGPEWDALANEQKTDWHYAAGTGPFVLSDYAGDNTMTFSKNPKYWDKDAAGNALPYLDEVQLVFMADRATVLSSFIAGELDVVVANSEVLNNDQAKQVISTLKPEEFTQYKYYSKPIGVSIKQGNNPVPALADKKVREAMQYAIDLKSISDYYGFQYDNVNDMICGVFLNGTPWNDVGAWSDDLLKSYTTYDPEKAKTMLAEAGYGSGFTFDVTIFQMQPVEAFQLAAEQLSKVGIKMNVHVVSAPNEMGAVGSDPNNPGCQFGSYGLENAQMVSFFLPYDGFANSVKQNDPELDNLTKAFLSSASAENQIAAAKKLDQYFMSQHYLLMTTYSEQTSNWYRSNVHGLNGERPSQNYYFGYMYARTWVDGN